MTGEENTESENSLDKTSVNVLIYVFKSTEVFSLCRFRKDSCIILWRGELHGNDKLNKISRSAFNSSRGSVPRNPTTGGNTRWQKNSSRVATYLRPKKRDLKVY